ncbi:MAG: T9SS type A sorting domain-containing protein [Flavobacteriales bacterium]
MKNLFLLTLLLGAFSSKAQLDPFLGIYPIGQCDFTSNCSFVVIPDSLTNIWERGQSEKTILTHTGPVMITDSVNNYPMGTNAAFEIHWPAWNYYPMSFIMSFHHSMDSDSLMDGGIIEVSRDHGTTWTNIIEDQTNMLFLQNHLYTSTDTLFTGEKGFSGSFTNRYTEIEWVWMLPLKDMPEDTMYYRFRFISDSIENNREGWMISDIQFSYADLGSGIEELSLFDLSVSPNPSNGFFEVQSKFEVKKAVISDLNGNIITSELTNTKKALNYSGLSKGVYFLQLQSNSNLWSQRKKIIID